MALFDNIQEMAFGPAFDFFWEPAGGDGALGRDKGLIVQGYADIPGANLNYETTKVPGRDGELIEAEDYRSNIEIGMNLAVDLSQRREGSLKQTMRELRTWLTGKGRVTFSDSPESFYEVLKVELSGLSEAMPYFGTLTVGMTARPSEYLWSGVSAMPSSSLKLNPFGLCRPIYKITGDGAGVLTVNGSAFSVNVGGNLTIDTDRQQSYREDGTLQNTEVTGDYTDLWLPPGAAEVTITSGLTCEVIPRWEVMA